MIPSATTVVIGQDIELVDQKELPSLTYKIDFHTGRIAGKLDGREAIKQAIYKILLTERFDYLIYSWNYGAEMNALIGYSFEVFESEVKRVVREALLADQRITDVHTFVVTRTGRDTANVSFVADTTLGEIEVDVATDATGNFTVSNSMEGGKHV